MNAVTIIKPVQALAGGIFPQENKAQSLTTLIQAAPLPKMLSIVVTQPGFADAEILVAKGDHVLKGQVIAKGKETSLAYHASSSGIVENIGLKAVPNQSGLEELCIDIQTDGKDQWLTHSGVDDFRKLNSEQLLTLIEEAGINGLGGAGFPSHAKISSAPHINTLIINACECEPFITADDALMREQADNIIIGIQILQHLVKQPHCLIGIEDNKPEALEALKKAITKANLEDDIQCVVVPSKYPSGAEKQLIQLLTGQQIQTGSFATQAGILCQNVATVYAIAKAICEGEALVSRVTTLTGAALSSPCNLNVLIGTPIDFLLEHCGLQADKLSNLIMGGSLMGISLTSTHLPVIKTTACLIATTDEEIPPAPPAQACIRCGMCVDACPVNLLPQQLYWFARSKEHDKARSHNIADCIECGACAFVCPSHIPLVQYYRASKAAIREENLLHHKAEHSKIRFEHHEIRIEADKLAAEQRRKERSELARKNREVKAATQKDNPNENSNAKALDPIQAALERVKAKKAAQLNTTSSETKQ